MGDPYNSDGGFGGEGQTKFDTGLSQVYRLDGEFKRCNWFRRTNELDNWHKCLMTLYVEGYPMFSKRDNEEKEIKDEEKKFTPLKDHKDFQTSYSKFLKTNPMSEVVNNDELLGRCWNMLFNYELKLRKSLDHVGLGHSEKEQDIY